MFCPHCGSSLPDGTQFCTECGTAIHAPSQPANYGYGAYQQSNQQYAQQSRPYGQPGQSYGQPDQSYGQSNKTVIYSPAPTSSYNQQPPTGALQSNRSILTYILLCLVTCGIYGYWFVYTMAQDANAACANDGDETPGLVVYVLLSLVTCGIYSYYWQYKLANRIQSNAPTYGITIQEGGSDVLIWYILGLFTCGICAFIAMHILIKNMNTLCAAYNRAHGYA